MSSKGTQAMALLVFALTFLSVMPTAALADPAADLAKLPVLDL